MPDLLVFETSAYPLAELFNYLFQRILLNPLFYLVVAGIAFVLSIRKDLPFKKQQDIYLKLLSWLIGGVFLTLLSLFVCSAIQVGADWQTYTLVTVIQLLLIPIAYFPLVLIVGLILGFFMSLIKAKQIKNYFMPIIVFLGLIIIILAIIISFDQNSLKKMLVWFLP